MRLKHGNEENYENKYKKAGCRWHDDCIGCSIIHILYSGWYVKMLSSAASFKRAGRDIFRTWVCPWIFVLHGIDSQSDGNW